MLLLCLELWVGGGGGGGGGEGHFSLMGDVGDGGRYYNYSQNMMELPFQVDIDINFLIKYF